MNILHYFLSLKFCYVNYLILDFLEFLYYNLQVHFKHWRFKKSFSLLTASLLFSGLLFARNPDSESHVVRIGYFEDNVFHVGQTDGDFKKGYGYEYYSMLSKYTGWEYEYYYGSWSEVYQAFLDGRIDIIDDVSITDERKNFMNFSDLPMGQEHYYIFIPKDYEGISVYDKQTLNGKRIGVNEHSLNLILLEQFLEKNNLSCEIVMCKGVKDRVDKINNGLIDGMVTTDGFSQDGFRPTFEIGTNSFYFGVQKDKPELLARLNMAMKRNFEVNANYNTMLREKYFKKSIIFTSLTQEENAYIKSHPVIKLGYRKISLPYSGQDETTGEMTGLIRDVVDDFEKNIKLKFEATGYDSTLEMIDALKTGQVDCIYPVMDNVWFSEQMGYMQTTPLTQERMALIFKGKYKSIPEYKKIGYTKGAPVQQIYLIEHELGEELVGYNSDAETVAAIQRGEVDCMIMNAVGWSHYSQTYEGTDNLNAVTLDEDVGYSMAVARKNNLLYSILEAAISQLDNGMLTESVNRHSQIQGDYSLKSFIEHNSEVFFILIVALFLLVTAAIMALERNRVRHKILSYNAEHDILSGVYNRSYLKNLDDKSQGKKVCLAMIDIDDFKAINDTYGHDTGDQVIKKVAYTLESQTRNSDIVIRFGGDEFMVLMMGLDPSSEKIIRNKFEKIQAALENTSDFVPICSISAGIAFSSSGYNQELFSRADEALYTSKRSGRHKITVSLSSKQFHM